MPKVARERVASPPAGTALARAIRECLPGRVRLGRDSIMHVTLSVTNVNVSVTRHIALSPCGRGRRMTHTARHEPGEGYFLMTPNDARRLTPHPPSLYSGALSRKGRGKSINPA
jgi:hypothetical protein